VAVSGEREMVTMNRNRTEPMYAVTASMRWTPEVINIARPFVCSAGIKDPKAVWASFVPIVTNSKLYHYNFTHKQVHGLVRRQVGLDSVGLRWVDCAKKL